MENNVKISVPVIITLIITSIMITMFIGWVVLAKEYMQSANIGSAIVKIEPMSVNNAIKGKTYPIINAKNMRIKQGTDFNVRNYVTAIDNNNGMNLDISNKISYYGEVDTNKKGVYEIRCVVRNSLGMKTVKTIQILVD